jgi:hypothetical protein
MWSLACNAFWERFSDYLTRPRYDDVSYLLGRIDRLWPL